MQVQLCNSNHLYNVIFLICGINFIAIAGLLLGVADHCAIDVKSSYSNEHTHTVAINERHIRQEISSIGKTSRSLPDLSIAYTQIEGLLHKSTIIVLIYVMIKTSALFPKRALVSQECTTYLHHSNLVQPDQHPISNFNPKYIDTDNQVVTYKSDTKQSYLVKAQINKSSSQNLPNSSQFSHRITQGSTIQYCKHPPNQRRAAAVGLAALTSPEPDVVVQTREYYTEENTTNTTSDTLHHGHPKRQKKIGKMPKHITWQRKREERAVLIATLDKLFDIFNCKCEIKSCSKFEGPFPGGADCKHEVHISSCSKDIKIPVKELLFINSQCDVASVGQHQIGLPDLPGAEEKLKSRRGKMVN
ncbi:Protein of unknown function [Gryllus bimaculatus]|nr:Protein of unknown function [Gryllus bimaculatus]